MTNAKVASAAEITDALIAGGIQTTSVKKRKQKSEPKAKKPEVREKKQTNNSLLNYLANPILLECPKCTGMVDKRGFKRHVNQCDGNIETFWRKRALLRIRKEGVRVTKPNTYFHFEFDGNGNMLSWEEKDVPNSVRNKASVRASETRRANAKAKREAKERVKVMTTVKEKKPEQVVSLVHNNEVAGELEALISIMEEHIEDSKNVSVKQWNEWKAKTTILWRSA